MSHWNVSRPEGGSAGTNNTEGEELMTFRPRLLFATMVAACAFAGTAGAQTGIAQIPIPGDQSLASYDISYVDQASQRYFLADRTNKGIDIIDAKANKFLGRVAGMKGLAFKGGKP